MSWGGPQRGRKKWRSCPPALSQAWGDGLIASEENAREQDEAGAQGALISASLTDGPMRANLT